MKHRFFSAGVLILVLAAPLGAQTTPRLGFFVGGVGIRVRDGGAGRVQTLSSTLPQGDVNISLGRLLLEGGYTQGSLTAEASAPPRDYVEGKALAGVHITPAISLKTGAHARSYVLPGGTRRRLYWEARGAFDTPLS